ncbi:MAG: glycosyltransferase family 2 protein [Planctomycetaceae bacterium]|nr:glycosyltransferase family 2 protein [Planctomycetaceae bacterium]
MNSATTPRISVVIPAYKAADFIGRAIDSVWAQTLSPIEVIVVNDGSPDDTAEFVQQRDGHRVRLISQENAGPGAARNHGIREAQGEWIALLDADDTWMPEKLERQSAQISDEIGIVHCFVSNGLPAHVPQGEVTFDAMWERNYIGTSTVLMRKQAWQDVGGFDEDRNLMGAEDYNLWLRIIHAGYRVATLREPLAYYTPADDSIMSNVMQIVRAELLNIEKSAEKFDLPESQAIAKQLEIWDEYGRTLLWQRDKPQARQMFHEILKRRPTTSALMHWMATFVPNAVLDLKRNLSSTTS